jgi:hypothetical protein
VRLIRNRPGIISIKDAAEFGHTNNNKLKVSKSDSRVFHYGWVKSPRIMLEKSKDFEKYWHDKKYIREKYEGLEEFDFKMLAACKQFRGSHPSVMEERITNWNIPLPRAVPRRPLIFRKITWFILLRKWGIIKQDWF